MNYCVLVKISKHKVSFWYQSGSSPYAALIIKDSNEVPLYFYVNGTDFIFGEDLALNRFNSNDPNAFGNYFEIIKDPGNHFTIAGNKKPVKQLLYHGIEKYLNFFITQVLYKNDSLESYRQRFPLRFWFESDIEDKEKSLIENLFNEAGYDNIERLDYNESLFQALAFESVINPNSAVLLLNGINNTLYIELYKNISAPITESSKLEGHGADPSVQLLAEMILEDILAQESYLTVNKEVEVAFLLSYSATRLENISPIIKGDALLTDGKKHYFEVRHRVLNERLLYYSNDSVIYAAINDILSSNSVNIQNLTVLMGSKEINTSYMINKLLAKYPVVKGVDQKYFNDAIKLMFAKVAQSGFQVKNVIKPEVIEKSTAFSPPVMAPMPTPPKVTAPQPMPPRSTPPPPTPPKVTAPQPTPPKVTAPMPTPPKVTAPPPMPPRSTPPPPTPPKVTAPPPTPPKVTAPPPMPPRPTSLPPMPPKVTAPPPMPPRLTPPPMPPRVNAGPPKPPPPPPPKKK